MTYIVDDSEFFLGCGLTEADPECFERTDGHIKESPELTAARIEGILRSWDCLHRRQEASERMKRYRADGTITQQYTDERNARVAEGLKRSWAKRKELSNVTNL